MRCSIAGRGLTRSNWRTSDRVDHFIEGRGDAKVTTSGVDAKGVVASSEVLHERVTADDHTRGPVGLEPAHRTQPRLQSSVVALDPVVRVPAGVVTRIRLWTPAERDAWNAWSALNPVIETSIVTLRRTDGSPRVRSKVSDCVPIAYQRDGIGTHRTSRTDQGSCRNPRKHTGFGHVTTLPDTTGGIVQVPPPTRRKSPKGPEIKGWASQLQVRNGPVVTCWSQFLDASLQPR